MYRNMWDVSRRSFLQGSMAVAGMALAGPSLGATPEPQPLEEVAYGQVTVRTPLVAAQAENTHSILMGMSNDSLIKPFLVMGGPGDKAVDAPGEDLGGWYTYFADFNYRIPQKVGFCPGSTFGQWVSALSRSYAATGDPATREKVLALNAMFARAIASDPKGNFFEKTRFPSYTFDKMTCGLVDSAKWAGDMSALKTLSMTVDVVAPHLPPSAVEFSKPWRPGKDDSWTWDESYTLPENLYKAYSLGGGQRFRTMAEQYLDDEGYFNALAAGEPAVAGKHAYSHVNAMSSAMQAYLVDGSEKHLRAAKNGFDMVDAQSYATGGWGPDERLRKPGSEDIYESLKNAHNSFETPCGAYGHMKLTRYLLRVTRDGRYGDSLERVLWNTVLGALPLQPDGTAFYYQDVTFKARRVYSEHTWPCCSGTLPQVAQDYGICSYFRESATAHREGSVWVSQYFASMLRWNEGGAKMELEQRAPKGQAEYPFGDGIELHVKASRATHFAMKLRIPAWCNAATIRVNGRLVPTETVKGFATISRTWRNGDVVELGLPSTVRIVAGLPAESAAKHPDIAALMQGPLVLMAILPSQNKEQPKLTREQALATQRISATEWRAETATEPMKLAPYTEIGDARYSTYLKIASTGDV
jgi:uncharacterized protein